MQAVSEEIIHARAELEKQTTLNEKLENDLLLINQRASNGASEEPASDVQDGLSGLKLGQKSTACIFIYLPLKDNEPYVVQGTERAATPQADNSILPIVTSQRDRFRQRNAELEEVGNRDCVTKRLTNKRPLQELRKQFESISELRGEIKTLQSDNMKLYEKVRYMQSYRDEGSASWSSVAAQANSDLGKYRTMYEDSLNPFQAFRGQASKVVLLGMLLLILALKEAARAVQDLNIIERTVLVITRQVLGNRRARAAFIGYAFFLHGLVLYITYQCAGSSRNSVRVPAEGVHI